MDHAIPIKRHIPCAEHIKGDLIARILIGITIKETLEFLPGLPGHGQQPTGGKFIHWFGHMHRIFISQHMAIQPHVFCFALVIKLFAQAGGKFFLNVLRINRTVIPLIDRKGGTKLFEVGLHGGGHIRILQLARNRAPVGQGCLMHLTKGRGRHRLAAKIGKA